MGNCLGRHREENYKLSKKAAQPIQSDVLKMLVELIGIVKAEDLTRVLYFLSSKYAEGKADRYVQLLEDVIRLPDDFKRYVEQIEQEAKSEDNESAFKQGVEYLDKKSVNQLVKSSDTPKSVRHFLSTLYRLSEVDMKSILEVCMKNDGDKVKQQFIENLLQVDFFGPKVIVGLALTYLTIEVGLNICSWWGDEISGDICVKNIIDCVVGLAGGIAGWFGGQAAGAVHGNMVGGPGGALIGGAIGIATGGITGYTVAKSLSNKLTQQMFGLSKEKALENAYTLLGASANSSNGDINASFRKLARSYDGDRDKMTMLHCSMELINAARKKAKITSK